MGLIIAGTLCSAWLLVLVLAILFQRRLLYHPQPDRAVANDHSPEIALQIDGPAGPIQAWLLHPDLLDSHPLVVFCGGNAQNAGLARLRLAERPWPSLCWNYPGYGSSAGTPSEASILAAGRALLDVVGQRFHPPAVLFMGRSLGAAVATSLAAEYPAAGLILISPAPSLRAVAAAQYPFLPIRWLMRDPWLASERAQALHCPLLALAAAEDRTIPATLSRAFVATYPGPAQWHLLPDQDHNNVPHHADYWPLIERFIAARADELHNQGYSRD